MSSSPFPLAEPEQVEELAVLLRRSKRAVAITGAGCSTGSGIPDYRGPNGTWSRRRPMSYAEFLRSADSRRHFWARNFCGWPRFAAAAPNAAHFALASLESDGALASTITQNVDDLHHRAGQQELIELHGQSNRVVCIQCGAITSRLELQGVLEELNEGWSAFVQNYNADADAEIDREATRHFRVADCATCGGLLKPDVVFFGESVPATVVEQCLGEIVASDLLLVVGSSLAVWSGFRFVQAAHDLGRTIVIVNSGPTRGDELATRKFDVDCTDFLARVADASS